MSRNCIVFIFSSIPTVRKRVINRGVSLNILEQALDIIRDEVSTVKLEDFVISNTNLIRFHKKEKLASEYLISYPFQGTGPSGSVLRGKRGASEYIQGQLTHTMSYSKSQRGQVNLREKHISKRELCSFYKRDK